MVQSLLTTERGPPVCGIRVTFGIKSRGMGFGSEATLAYEMALCCTFSVGYAADIHPADTGVGGEWDEGGPL